MTFGERREIPSLTDDKFFRILIAKPNRMMMVELMDEGHCHEFQGFGEGSASRAGLDFGLRAFRLFGGPMGINFTSVAKTRGIDVAHVLQWNGVTRLRVLRPT